MIVVDNVDPTQLVELITTWNSFLNGIEVVISDTMVMFSGTVKFKSLLVLKQKALFSSLISIETKCISSV